MNFFLCGSLSDVTSGQGRLDGGEGEDAALVTDTTATVTDPAICAGTLPATATPCPDPGRHTAWLMS